MAACVPPSTCAGRHIRPPHAVLEMGACMTKAPERFVVQLKGGGTRSFSGDMSAQSVPSHLLSNGCGPLEDKEGVVIGSRNPLTGRGPFYYHTAGQWSSAWPWHVLATSQLQKIFLSVFSQIGMDTPARYLPWLPPCCVGQLHDRAAHPRPPRSPAHFRASGFSCRNADGPGVCSGNAGGLGVYVEGLGVSHRTRGSRCENIRVHHSISLSSDHQYIVHACVVRSTTDVRMAVLV